MNHHSHNAGNLLRPVVETVYFLDRVDFSNMHGELRKVESTESFSVIDKRKFPDQKITNLKFNLKKPLRYSEYSITIMRS